MANAKMCDICGNFYVVPKCEPGMIWDEQLNTNMVRILRLLPEERGIKHDTMQFDACDKCLQDVLDYILNKVAVNNEFAE